MLQLKLKLIMLFIDKDMLCFKRGERNWIVWKPIYKKHDLDLKRYVCDSDHGTTILNDDFEYVLFLDASNPNINVTIW